MHSTPPQPERIQVRNVEAGGQGRAGRASVESTLQGNDNTPASDDSRYLERVVDGLSPGAGGHEDVPRQARGHTLGQSSRILVLAPPRTEREILYVSQPGAADLGIVPTCIAHIPP